MQQAIQIIIGGLVLGGVFAVIALGLSLVFRITGIINLAQGGFCLLGALLLYSFEASLGWPTPLAVAGAVVVTTLAGVALGAASFVPALARVPNSGMLMLSAGLLTVIEGVALVVWGSQPYAVPAFSSERPIDFAGIRVASQGLWIASVSAAVIVAAWYVLARTATGRALVACAENPLAARLLGVDVARLTLLSFGAAALIGAIGGAVVAPIMSLQFDAGRVFTNAGFIAVAIGGMSSLPGAIAGGFFLGVAEQLAAFYVSSLFANALALAVLLLTLLIRPQGLLTRGGARRADVREEPRIHRAVIRLPGRVALVAGLAAIVGLAVLPRLVEGGLLSSLTITGILFIAVLGLDVLMGYAGQVSLGQAGFMAIGGYTSAILATTYGVPPLLGIAAGIVLALAAALLLSAVTMRLRGAYLALATLSFGLLVDAMVVGLTELTGGPSGLVGIPVLTIGPVDFGTPQSMYYLVLGLIVVLIVALAGALRGDFGRALLAVRADQTAAAALGIGVLRHKLAAFAIAAALAALSGSLYAFHIRYLGPEMVATPRSFELIAMLILGGEGMLVGGLPGAALITLLPTVFQPLAGYKTLAEGAILVIAFQYLPSGLLGSLARLLMPVRAASTALAGALGDERAR